MIRNDTQYEGTLRRLAAGEARIRQQQAELQRRGLGPDEIKRVLDPLRCFYAQLQEELAAYERLNRRELNNSQDDEAVEEDVAAIQASLDDMQEGHTGRDVDEFLKELRDEFNHVDTE